MHECFWACILGLVLHVWKGLSQGVPFIQANCNEDTSLPCTVSDQSSSYRYMVWYRNETAIIKRNVNAVTFYNKSSPASLGVQGALVLQNVKPSDSGLYQCFLAANVGHKDMQSHVLLKVSECPTVSPFWTTTGKLCIPNVVEVPLLWSVLGFSFFSLAKILFCTITVIICKKQRGSEARSRSKSGRRRSDSYKHRNIKHI